MQYIFRRRQINDKIKSHAGLSTVLVFRARNSGDRYRIMQIRSMFIHRLSLGHHVRRRRTLHARRIRTANRDALLFCSVERDTLKVSESSHLLVETRLYAGIRETLEIF